MPPVHVAMMYVSIHVVKDVEAHKNVNKMSVENLCIVVASGFLWWKNEIIPHDGFAVVQFLFDHPEVFGEIGERVEKEMADDLKRLENNEERMAQRRKKVTKATKAAAPRGRGRSGRGYGVGGREGGEACCVAEGGDGLVAKNAALDEHLPLDKEASPSLLIDCSAIFGFDCSFFDQSC